MFNKKKAISIFAIIVIALSILYAALLVSENINIDPLLQNEKEYRVARVIDGDTVELDTGERVRYIGIDTPETVHPAREVECFGEEASIKNRELVEGRIVRLEKDISDRDRFNRLLRYVYVDDIFVNEFLVREGYARAISYPPDIYYQELFKEAEKDARDNKRGLWADGICD